MCSGIFHFVFKRSDLLREGGKKKSNESRKSSIVKETVAKTCTQLDYVEKINDGILAKLKFYMILQACVSSSLRLLLTSNEGICRKMK